MPVLLPMTADGCRSVMVEDLPGGPKRFRSHYSQGQADGWFLDVFEPGGKALLRGIRCVPGAADLLKGQGDRFREALVCVALAGSEAAPEALGNAVQLVWFGEGEANPFRPGDPLLDIPEDEWAFGEER